MLSGYVSWLGDSVVDSAHGRVIGSRVVSEVADEAEERLDGTKEGMRCGAVPYLFTTNGILLVSEGEVGGGESAALGVSTLTVPSSVSVLSSLAVTKF